MNDDLISRKELISVLEQWRDKDPYKKQRGFIERWIRRTGIHCLIIFVKRLPAAEPAPCEKCKEE